MIEFLLSRGANLRVLSPKQRELYQHLVPQVIEPRQYYLIEPRILQIINYPDRNILLTKNGRYTI